MTTLLGYLIFGVLLLMMRAALSGLRGAIVLLAVVIGIPLVCFGTAAFLATLAIPAVVIFIALCALWLFLAPA